MENDLKIAIEFFRSIPQDERRRALGSALIGMVEGAGDCDEILASVARRYVRAFRIVEQED